MQNYFQNVERDDVIPFGLNHQHLQEVLVVQVVPLNNKQKKSKDKQEEQKIKCLLTTSGVYCTVCVDLQVNHLVQVDLWFLLLPANKNQCQNHINRAYPDLCINKRWSQSSNMTTSGSLNSHFIRKIYR